MSGMADLRLGAAAPDFALAGVDGKTWRLADARGAKATLVMFICNHCPYVKSAISRTVRDAAELEPLGARAIAIMPNDVAVSPDDSFAKMKAFADAHRFTFPYVIDETQDVARAYGAVCTPDFFGFDADLRLRYHGRLDAGGMRDAPGMRRELFDAMSAIARNGQGPEVQPASIGCSIKWRGG